MPASARPSRVALLGHFCVSLLGKIFLFKAQRLFVHGKWT
uniref:Uncharacterized protein n=1 Tax=Mus musculus TaxID=10090 RepID=Q3V114_MOUSE|nr:unnamed protein product [Mus musculus]